MVDECMLLCVVTGRDTQDDLGRTHEYLINSMKSKANTCLICIETIKRMDAVSVTGHLGSFCNSFVFQVSFSVVIQIVCAGGSVVKATWSIRGFFIFIAKSC